MFARLANTRVQKEVELGVPSIKLQSNNKLTFNMEAIKLLKLGGTDKIDVLKGIESGKFYVANVGDGKLGRSLSKSGVVTNERISVELGGKDKVYKITETSVEHEGVDWFELELVVNTKVEKAKETSEDVVAEATEEIEA